jgi:hypothetical protein
MTEGEKWIRLLRAYGPVPDDLAQEAEQVDNLADRLGLRRLSFPHPAWQDLIDCFPLDTGEFKTVVLTGTAGDGKTTLCYQLVEKLTGSLPNRTESATGFQTFEISTRAGIRHLTIIYDLTGWRRREAGILSPENVAMLEEATAHVYGTGGHAYVLAVNDGQLLETIRSLPTSCTCELNSLGEVLVDLHATGTKEVEHLPLLRLINLSRTPSDLLMQLCLDGILSRPEWKCLESEKDNPLFGEISPVRTNYEMLKSPAVRHRLITLARIADATGHHLPLRSILILLSNALLGHPDAPDKVLRPDTSAKRILGQDTRHKAAIHLNLFGFNLGKAQRSQRDVYRFLSMLHAGEETTNDLDELILFGSRDDELQKEYNELVANDPFSQRNPALDGLVLRYIRGEITDGKESAEFLSELAHERRRIFFSASEDQLKHYRLWSITVFHHAGDFEEHILQPIREGHSPAKLHIRRLAGGLNRVWTGLLLDENAHEIYLATGLDLSTSPVSDLLLEEISIAANPSGFDIVSDGVFPKAVIRAKGRSFSFDLTLPRFEFLMRIAAGAMPSCFSRETYEDFLSLKQCCLRDLQIRPSSEVLLRLDVTATGQVHKEHIHLSE